jgi:hypothetical protein
VVKARLALIQGSLISICLPGPQGHFRCPSTPTKWERQVQLGEQEHRTDAVLSRADLCGNHRAHIHRTRVNSDQSERAFRQSNRPKSVSLYFFLFSLLQRKRKKLKKLLAFSNLPPLELRRFG